MDVSAPALAGLNDNRKFTVAAELYKATCDANDPIPDVAFHSQGYLAYSMTNGPVELAKWWLKACPDYDELTEADLWRDHARQIMRQHWPRIERTQALEKARSLLLDAAGTHQRLANTEEEPELSRAMAHYLADKASLARFDYLRGSYGAAYDTIAEVIEDLDTIQKNTNASYPEVTTYLRNAAFDGLRAATRLHLHHPAAHFARFVTKLDPSGKKRWAARAIHYGRWPALILIEHLFR